MKHTPGPWEVATSLSNKTFVTIPNEKIGMAHSQICEIIDDISEGDHKANAKLISAAPDLFRALEIAMYEIKEWHEYNYNQIESFDNNGTNNERDMQADVANSIYEKLQIIKAAIKKATA